MKPLKENTQKRLLARVVNLTKYGKLILYVEDEASMKLLDSTFDKFSEIKSEHKAPIWPSEKEDEKGLYCKLSVPKWMDKWTINRFISKMCKVAFVGKTYEHEEYGKGWFLALAHDLKLVV